MKLKELFGIVGIPMDHTAGPQGLKKVTKNYMGKVRTYYAPKSKKFNEKNKEKKRLETIMESRIKSLKSKSLL